MVGRLPHHSPCGLSHWHSEHRVVGISRKQIAVGSRRTGLPHNRRSDGARLA
jgi:hypothetical protein